MEGVGRAVGMAAAAGWKIAVVDGGGTHGCGVPRGRKFDGR
ncbi:MAG: hypothetical protein ACOC9I_00565 [Actinomycetota bacterium]